jgi:chemotaxis protein histidine kinase CheA
VVRQVSQGQTKTITAQVDLTGVPPGRHQAFVDVECDNCGFFIFQSCKIDKQSLRILVQANPPAAAGQPNPVTGNARMNPDDPDLPEPVRNRLRAAYLKFDGLGNNAKLQPCDREVEKKRKLAEAERAKADKLKAAADAAEKAAQTAREAEAKRRAAEAERAKAGRDLEDAAKDETEKKALADGDENAPRAEQKQNDKDLEDAREKRKAAEEAVHEKQKVLQDARDAEEKAKADAAAAAANAPRQSDVDEAEARAKAAEAAAKAAADQCEADRQAAQSAAENEIKAAEEVARRAKTAAIIDLETRIQTQEDKVKKCRCKYQRLLAAQVAAYQALDGLGSMSKNDLSAIQAKLKSIIGFMEATPLGVCLKYIDTLKAGLRAIDAALSVAKELEAGYNAVLVPGTKDHYTTAGARGMTLDYIRNSGLSEPEPNGPTAEEIYEQMKSYTGELPGTPDSPAKMDEDLKNAKDHCDSAETELKNMKEDLDKAKGQ